MIIYNAIWFSDSFDFNDPYDCNLKITANHTFEELYNHLIGISQKIGFLINEQEIKAKAERWSENPNEFRQLIKNNETKELNNKGIACFSKSDEVLLLWSHYANSHRGACLGFDRTKDPDFFYQLYNV